MTRVVKELVGPAEFAQIILQARHDFKEEKAVFGDISEAGLGRLIQLAYYAGLSPNEGRYPRLKLLVPAKGEKTEPFVRMRHELTSAYLRRVGPALSSPGRGLVIAERDGKLESSGIVALSGGLTELSFGDPVSRPSGRPKGLTIEVTGPGELHISEHRMFRLQAGTVYQELSFIYERWFSEWYEELAGSLFGWTAGWNPAASGWRIQPQFAVAATWMSLLRRAADLRHGGSFLILPDPAHPAIRHAYRTSDCNVGEILRDVCQAVRTSSGVQASSLPTEEARQRVLLRERLLSALEAVANLSATDGCVVFNRRLELQSFGSMIEAPAGEGQSIPCFIGDSADQLEAHQLRSFGARRRSAIQLCQACPGAKAFVISQDGELRVFVRVNGKVRLYDNLAYW